MIRALDTNIIIDLLSKEPLIVRRLDETINNNVGVVIPVVVDYEVLRGFYHTSSPRKETAYFNMRANCPVVDITATMWKRAARIWAELRRAGHAIGEADILIAACCIENEYVLTTRNVKHFKAITGLLLEDWAE